MTPEFAAGFATLAMNQGLLFTQALPDSIACLLLIAARPEMRDKMP